MEDEKYIKKLGENIKRLRKAKGISQKDLAYDAGIEKQNMRRLEAGKTNPTVKTLLRIARALEILLPDLLKF